MTEADGSSRIPMETREGALKNERGIAQDGGGGAHEVGDGSRTVKVDGVLKLAP